MSPRKGPSRKPKPLPATGKPTVLQLKITLKGFRPPIWRRVKVPSDATLEDLHHVIQTAMGWEDYHLHQFLLDRVYYSGLAPDGSDVGWDDEMQDERKVTLGDVVRRKGQRFLYEYDMGDSWEHDILVEKRIGPEEGMCHPVCIAGERACPPEDCGGVWGYAEALDALQNPGDPEHEELREWLPEDFDPEAFDAETVNERLQYFRDRRR